jgi:hypothetical protein
LSLTAPMNPVVGWFGTWFSWFPPFAQSPGFAGVLAVAAAAIAYYAAARNGRKDRWWKRAEYALNLTLSADEAVQLAGIALLETLLSKDPEEQKFITTAAAGLIPLPDSNDDSATEEDPDEGPVTSRSDTSNEPDDPQPSTTGVPDAGTSTP